MIIKIYFIIFVSFLFNFIFPSQIFTIEINNTLKPKIYNNYYSYPKANSQIAVNNTTLDIFEWKIIASNKKLISIIIENDIWENIYAHSVRKNVKKATRSGLTVKYFSGDEISEQWFSKFKNIYTK